MHSQTIVTGTRYILQSATRQLQAAGAEASVMSFLVPIAMEHFEPGQLSGFFTFMMVLQPISIKLFALQTNAYRWKKCSRALEFRRSIAMPYQIIGLGEILWDVFPDGPRFGGAPANFACSAAELAHESAHVTMLSAVGDDELGRAALVALQNRGVEAAVQINSYPTGRVDVELDADGAASYQFAEDSAWDHLAWNSDLAKLAADCDAVCFGTLGQRGVESQDTIRTFVQATPLAALRVLDVNIRRPFFSDELILRSLELANVLKLNDEELPLIGRLCGCGGSDIEIMREIAARFELRHVALTRGADGAVIVSADSVSDLPGVAIDVVDTVGAGDAYTAAMTLGILAGHGLEAVNRSAMATASYVCSQPGATMPFPNRLRCSEQE